MRANMARYFFHIEYGDHLRDPEGTELSSPAAARAEAVALLGYLLADEGDSFWTKPNVKVTVTDQSGRSLWTIETLGFEIPPGEGTPAG